jgi:aminopeptidase C, putative
MNWYLKCWKQYADFSGRARRKEYWIFSLINNIIIFFLYILQIVTIESTLWLIFPIILFLYAMAVFLPGLAVNIRRLHDIGKSGWWYLIYLIPIIGAIWLTVLMCLDSEPGENQWGENPKEIEY